MTDINPLIAQLENAISDDYVRRPLLDKYLVGDEAETARKKTAERLDKLYKQREGVSENYFKLLEILKAQYRGENPTHDYKEVPDVVHNIVQGPVNVAAAKVSTALFSSDLLNRFISSEWGRSDAAERVERFIQARITELPQNREAIAKAIHSAALVGIGWTETIVEDEFFVEGNYDIEEIDATDEERKEVPVQKQYGKKRVRYKYIQPGRIMLDPHKESYFEQAYIIKRTHLSTQDLRCKTLGRQPIYDTEVVEQCIKANADGIVPNISAVYRENKSSHPYFDNAETEPIKYHLVVDFYNRNGMVYTLVDHEYLVRVEQDTTYGMVDIYSGPPFVPWIWDYDHDSPYGIGIGQRLMSLQKDVNTTAGLLTMHKYREMFKSTVINTNALDMNAHPNIISTYRPGMLLFAKTSAHDIVSHPDSNIAGYQVANESLMFETQQAEEMSGVSDVVRGMDSGGRRTAAQATMTNANAHTTFDSTLQRITMISLPVLGATTLRALKQMLANGELSPTEYFRVSGPNGQEDYVIGSDDFDVQMDIRPGVDVGMANNANHAQAMQQLLTLQMEAPGLLPQEATYSILRSWLKALNIKEPERFIGPRDHTKSLQERINRAIMAYQAGEFDYTIEVGRFDDHAFFLAQYGQMIAGQLGMQAPEIAQMMLRAMMTHKQLLTEQEIKQGMQAGGGIPNMRQQGGGMQPQGMAGTYNQQPASYDQLPATAG